MKRNISQGCRPTLKTLHNMTEHYLLNDLRLCGERKRRERSKHLHASKHNDLKSRRAADGRNGFV